MKPTQQLNADAAFFFEHAGYSHTPLTETPEQGRTRCALNLAACEGIARNAGYSYQWEVDTEIDSSSFSDESPAWPLWQCLMFDCHGNVVQALGGVDFGPKGGPAGSDYRRVCEAELASQECDEVLATAATATPKQAP